MRRGWLIVVLAGLVYGGGSQYLGSITHWGWAVGGLSAPWLALPFLAGTGFRVPRPAMAAGLVVTFAALLGYMAMILSPVEGTHLSPAIVMATVRSQAAWEVGGLFTGPAFGWLGWRWRTRRSWAGPAVVAGALCLEPFDGRTHLLTVSMVEMVAGILLGTAFLAAARLGRRRWNPGL